MTELLISKVRADQLKLLIALGIVWQEWRERVAMDNIPWHTSLWPRNSAANTICSTTN